MFALRLANPQSIIIFHADNFDWEYADSRREDALKYAAFLVALEKGLVSAWRTPAWAKYHTGDWAARRPRVSVATGGIGYDGMPGTAGFCGHTGGWWNCSQVDPAGLVGSNVTVLPMNTYDYRDGCWYSAVGAVHATVPVANRGVGLGTCKGMNCSFTTYMDPDALGKRFATLEKFNINSIGLYGGNLFNALGEYIPLLQAFLKGDGTAGPEGGAIPPFSPGCW